MCVYIVPAIIVYNSVCVCVQAEAIFQQLCPGREFHPQPPDPEDVVYEGLDEATPPAPPVATVETGEREEEEERGGKEEEEEREEEEEEEGGGKEKE